VHEVIFYRDKNGNSEIVDYLDELQTRALSSKNDRINRQKILAYIDALSKYGTALREPIVKHIEGSIWELRPLNNRIFFFYWKDDKFVLLHHYAKKSQKTPLREIERAKNELKDFLKRNDI